MTMKFVILVCLVTLTSRCATLGKSIGLGAGIGAGAGMGIGAIADPNADGEFRTRNVIIGGALGAIVGMAVGSSVHKGKEKAKKEGAASVQSTGNPSTPGNQPMLSQPKVESRWVESRVVGNRFVEGHFEYVITEPAKWEGSQ